MPRHDAPSTPSLQAIQDQLTAVLEERVTDLMTQIKSTQALSRQIARTEEEIERQRLLQERLEAELGPLRHESAQLQAQTQALQGEVDELLDSVSRMRNIREELLAIKGGTPGGSRS
jgi:chromosome segregation ATPase